MPVPCSTSASAIRSTRHGRGIGGRAGKEIPHGQRNAREAGLRYRIWIATLACLLLAAAVTGAMVGYRRKLRHRDAQLSEYLTLLESYRESHDSLTSRLDASNEREAAVKASLEGGSPCCATSPQPTTPMAKGNGWRGR